MNPTQAWSDLCGKLDAQNAHLESIARGVAAMEARPVAPVPLHQTLSFEVSTVGWNQIIPPNPNHLCIAWLLCVAASTQTIQFGQGQSDGDAGPFHSAQKASAGILPLIANSGFNAQIPYPSALFTTDPGLGFWVKLGSDAIAVDGYVSYWINPRHQQAA